MAMVAKSVLFFITGKFLLQNKYFETKISVLVIDHYYFYFIIKMKGLLKSISIGFI
jgi:hypothetical protein